MRRAAQPPLKAAQACNNLPPLNTIKHNLQVAAPGDVVMLLPDNGRVSISSTGLRPAGGAVVASKCGVVRRTRGGQLWLEGRQKRWVLEDGEWGGWVKEHLPPVHLQWGSWLLLAHGGCRLPAADSPEPVLACCSCAANLPKSPYFTARTPPRYIPAEGDSVVGVVIDRMGEVSGGGTHGMRTRPAALYAQHRRPF